MANLKTNYMGLELKNPIIIGSCNLSSDFSLLEKMQEAGAAAIVYKSLFEEQVQLERLKVQNKLHEFDDRNAEMTRIFPNFDDFGPEEHLFNLAKAVKKVDIPIIGSLNAVNHDTWVEYAKKIESVGVAALELNLYTHPANANMEVPDIVGEQLKVAAEVVNAVKIPVSVKISPFYTNVLRAAQKFEETGIKGFVMFNKLFQPDIDIENEKRVFPYNLSYPEENRLPLRYTGLLYGNIKPSICANTGIFTGDDVIKMLLAGADTVQIVSTLYKNKIEVIEMMLFQIENWMNKKSYDSLDDFKGKLSAKNSTDPFAYRRSQYVELIMKSDEIFKTNIKP